MKGRCDNCGRKADVLYSLGFFQGRIQWGCWACLVRIAGGVTQAERAVRRRAA